MPELTSSAINRPATLHSSRPAGSDQVVSHRATDRILASLDRQQVTMIRVIERLEQLRPVGPVETAIKGDSGHGTLGAILDGCQSVEDKLDYIERIVNEL